MSRMVVAVSPCITSWKLPAGHKKHTGQWHAAQHRVGRLGGARVKQRDVVNQQSIAQGLSAGPQTRQVRKYVCCNTLYAGAHSLFSVKVVLVGHKNRTSAADD